MARILLAEDDDDMRRFLVKALERAGYDVADFDNGASAYERLREEPFSLLLTDIVMPEMDGIGATSTIKQNWPNIEVLVMTSFIEDEKVFGAMRAGATGYVLKDADPDVVVAAIRSAAAGESPLDPRVVRRLMQEFNLPKSKTQSTPEPLSEREIEVLRLVAKGYSNHQIADNLIISPKTAKTHVSNILGKLGLASRTQAAVYALKEGLVSADEAVL
jgi:NarL family two-component system response regulator LiaR